MQVTRRDGRRLSLQCIASALVLCLPFLRFLGPQETLAHSGLWDNTTAPSTILSHTCILERVTILSQMKNIRMNMFLFQTQVPFPCASSS